MSRRTRPAVRLSATSGGGEAGKRRPRKTRAGEAPDIAQMLGSDRWFGLPRWLVVCVGIALLLGYGTFGRPVEEPEPVSAQVRTIVDGLRTTSVYEAPGSPRKVDVEQARKLIGDRPIVLVLLDETPLPPATEPLHTPIYDLCDEIAAVVTTSLVLLYATDEDGEYRPAYCTGPEFANPQNPVDPSNYDFGLIAKAEVAWKYRSTEDNKFPEVEEFIYAFDEQAAEDYPGGVPRRAVVTPPPPEPDTIQTWQIVLSLAGILLGTVALFILLRLAGRLITKRGAAADETSTRREVASARLNRLADSVLHPRRPEDAAEAQRQAAVAERYVLLLSEYDTARSRDGFSEVEQLLTELEQEVSR